MGRGCCKTNKSPTPLHTSCLHHALSESLSGCAPWKEPSVPPAATDQAPHGVLLVRKRWGLSHTAQSLPETDCCSARSSQPSQQASPPCYSPGDRCPTNSMITHLSNATRHPLSLAFSGSRISSCSFAHTCSTLWLIVPGAGYPFGDTAQYAVISRLLVTANPAPAACSSSQASPCPAPSA